MGQVGSLPDGSELKEPEEKVSPSTLVNANFGLVFVKPHAHKPDCIDFVKDELSKKVKILGVFRKHLHTLKRWGKVIRNSIPLRTPSHEKLFSLKASEASALEKLEKDPRYIALKVNMVQLKDAEMKAITTTEEETGKKTAQQKAEEEVYQLKNWYINSEEKLRKIRAHTNCGISNAILYGCCVRRL